MDQPQFGVTFNKKKLAEAEELEKQLENENRVLQPFRNNPERLFFIQKTSQISMLSAAIKTGEVYFLLLQSYFRKPLIIVSSASFFRSGPAFRA